MTVKFSSDYPSQETRDPGTPMAGDIIWVKYRWADPAHKDKNGNPPAEKIRPCVIIKTARDGSSIIVSPISTTPNRDPGRPTLPIPPEEAKRLGLKEDKISHIKPEFNKINLPNMSIIPNKRVDGRLSWRLGVLDEKVFKAHTTEIAFAAAENRLYGKEVQADTKHYVELTGLEVITSAKSSVPLLTIHHEKLDYIKKRALEVRGGQLATLPKEPRISRSSNQQQI